MLQTLAAQHWLIEEGYLNRILAILQSGRSLESLIKKQTIQDYVPRLANLLSVAEVEPHASAHDLSPTLQLSESNGLPVVQTKQGNVALIPVIGALTKYGDMCSYGMQDYQSMIAKANADASIDGMVLVMDTPGGTVDGTPEFGLSVKNSPKPVGVFGDGMVASAGMWVASQADVIVGNKNNPTAFGSIGTLMVKQDMANLVEAGRMQRVEIIRAPQSTEKALINSVEPLTEETRAMLMDELRSITNEFIGTVKAGRGDALDVKADGLFKGRMFDTYKAKQIGLIDSVGTLQTAVNKVAELAKEKKKMTTTGSNAQNDTMSKPNWFASIFGKTETEAAGLTEEQAQEEGKKEIAALRASLKAAEDEKAALSARISTLEEQFNTAAAAADAAAKQVKELTESNTKLQGELDKKPTGQATTIISDAEREARQANEKKEKEKNYRTSADDEADKLAALAKTNPFKK